MDSILEENRNQQMGIDTTKKRQERQDLAERAHPQRGVDLLKNAFPTAADIPPPGVREGDPASGEK